MYVIQALAVQPVNQSRGVELRQSGRHSFHIPVAKDRAYTSYNKLCQGDCVRDPGIGCAACQSKPRGGA